MIRAKWLILFSVVWMLPAKSFAAEEPPADKLVMQAKIPRNGEILGFGPKHFAREELPAERLIIQAKIQRKAKGVLGFGFDSLWMTSGKRLTRVNPADNSVIDIEISSSGAFYRAMAIGEGAVWVPATSKKMLLKVDPITNKLVQEIPAQMLSSEGSIGAGEGGVWVITATGSGDTNLTRFNPASGAVDAIVPLPSNSAGVVVDFGAVWVTGTNNGELYRIDPTTNTITSTVKLHEWPRFIASGEGSIWVFNQSDGTVQRIDGKTAKLLATIETGLPGKRSDIACGGGYVWVSAPGTPVAQIDPRTNTLVREFKGSLMGEESDAIRYGAGSLWVSGRAIYRIRPPD
jgi:virginiamycin B lyase